MSRVFFCLKTLQSRPPTTRGLRSAATAAHRHHPHPGNFASHPREEVDILGQKGHRKGTRVKASGGLHSMDPEKKREILSAGLAKRKAAREHEQAIKDFGRNGSAHVCHKWESHEPAIVPPGFGEWKT